ncbi:MAG: PD-(D/E)XK nuclease family protein, partial [Bacteroidetes bacterium]|nr:PD-(D/E)XK nuclease family protein [Bacteroidota bacterium]
DLLRLFRNPVIISLFEEQEYTEIINAINNDHEFFISPETFVRLVRENDIMQSIFSDWKNDSRTASENLIRFGEFLLNKLEINPDFQEGFEVDNLFEILKLLRKMNSMQQLFSNTGNFKTFNALFRQQLRSATLPFVGEPLEGLQIMGLLEARNLDFKNLIMLSVNENVVPKAKTNNSFIPLDIAVGFGLPTYRDRDSVSAYHFYRLLQKASNVWLIYNTETDEFGKGEKSRYISQIEEEFIHTNTQITTELFAPEIGGFENFDINFTKSDKFLEDFFQLFSNDKSERSLSPTALSTFIDCKLKFFFRYFSEIKIPDEKEEDVGADELGNITHEILEKLYIPYQDKYLKPEDSEEMLARLDEVAEVCFEKEQSYRNYDEGPALLIKFGIINSIKRFLQHEYNQLIEYQKNGTTLKILQQEFKLNKNITLNFNGKDTPVRLGGKADRIDLITTPEESYIRIIDYKSGDVKSPDLKFVDFDDLISNRKSKLLQLLQYKYLAEEAFPGHEFKPGIISLRNVTAGFMPIKPADKKAGEFSISKHELESIFRHLITQIVNVEEKFEMTEDIAVCSYCDFAGICNRN